MADLNPAVVNRSLTTIRNELEFLKSSGVITDSVLAHFAKVLPQSYAPGMPIVDYRGSDIVTGAAPNAAPAARVDPEKTAYEPQQLEIGEAIYDYNPTDSSDLPLYRGAQIIVLEKINPDWWRGRDRGTGREGIFPSCYVRVIETAPRAYTNSPIPTAGPPAQQYMPPQPQPQQYIPPAQQYQPAPQQYQPPPQQMYQASPTPQPYYPPAQQQAAPAQASQPHEESQFEKQGKKFGKKLGNAAIFGAGATIGSNIVNSIF
ncbi:SH3 domain-containing protein [Limtongia smithiae]|uniref:SH3 domain-containing protein n=1 Tax=Limtongia smithiae TaxID=1125753 RepID=UPI0034CF87AA